MSPDLNRYREQCQTRLHARLQHWLDTLPPSAPRLNKAMRYAVMIGGKRLRPLLAYAACEACGGSPDDADDAACALELLHTYSLVHDDLPAMDDDALRRGQPTCHIAFDEATAILAGDALQTLAFEVLAHSALPAMTDAVKVRMIKTLATASGSAGMAGGQALDLAGEGCDLDLVALETIHRLKTGQLIRAAVEMGAQAAGATPTHAEALDRYADAIGLAFQVQDDVLDVIGDTGTLGKQQGADALLQKATYPRLLGLEAAQALAHRLCDTAVAALDGFDSRAEPLRAIARFIVRRDH